MDPITHTLVGATVAETGVRRFTPLAATTLVLAANAPDIDIVAHFAGPYVGLAHRRGITHGIGALIILPFVVTLAVFLLDRTIRRWRRPESSPVRPGPILALAFAGVLTHPFLDWLNTYGIRLLMPVDGRWFYGDALFIIDPWLWLGLGGVLFLLHSSRPVGIIGWGGLALVMTVAVMVLPIVPVAAKVIWTAGIAGFIVLRLKSVALAEGARAEASATLSRVALVGAALYVVSMILLDQAAQREVQTASAEAGILSFEEVMVAPEPANPFAGSIVIATASAYHLGSFDWFGEPRVAFQRRIERRITADARPVVAAAVQTEEVRDFLVWSRFPFYRVTDGEDGYRVRIGDARYVDMTAGGSLAGVTVRLDRRLRPR